MLLLVNFSSCKYSTKLDQCFFTQILRRLTFGSERKFLELFQVKLFPFWQKKKKRQNLQKLQDSLVLEKLLTNQISANIR